VSAPSLKSDSTTLAASLDANEFRQANAAADAAGAEIARDFAKASRRCARHKKTKLKAFSRRVDDLQEPPGKAAAGKIARPTWQ
jgi:hypothetical protein